jgi:hypothetical protein
VIPRPSKTDRTTHVDQCPSSYGFFFRSAGSQLCSNVAFMKVLGEKWTNIVRPLSMYSRCCGEGVAGAVQLLLLLLLLPAVVARAPKATIRRRDIAPHEARVYPCHVTRLLLSFSPFASVQRPHKGCLGCGQVCVATRVTKGCGRGRRGAATGDATYVRYEYYE